jgi:hypothetical protein
MKSNEEFPMSTLCIIRAPRGTQFTWVCYADAGYGIAIDVAKYHGLKMSMLGKLS